MQPTCTLQFHVRDAWHAVASVSPQGDGWQARATAGYAVDGDLLLAGAGNPVDNLRPAILAQERAVNCLAD